MALMPGGIGDWSPKLLSADPAGLRKELWFMQKMNEEERKREAIKIIEKELDSLKGDVYKNSPELQKSVKKNLVIALTNLPEPERTIYKLMMIAEYKIFSYFDLETELNIVIREAKQKTDKDSTAKISPKTAVSQGVDQKKLDLLLENAIPDKGFLRDYINVFSEATDCPRAFLFWGAMVMVATILGKNMYIKYIAEKICPNIWCVFLADSGGRKGTGINLVTNILSRVSKDSLLPTVASEEGLVGALDTSKKLGRDIGFIHWQEFSTILASWQN